MSRHVLTALLFIAAYCAIVALFVTLQRRALRHRQRRREEREAARRRVAVAHARLTEVRRLHDVLRRMGAERDRMSRLERDLCELAPLARQLAEWDPEPDRAWWSL